MMEEYAPSRTNHLASGGKEDVAAHIEAECIASWHLKDKINLYFQSASLSQQTKTEPKVPMKN